MGNLNEIQKQTTQSYGDNSFTTTIKENTVEFDSAKDSFTFNDEVNVPSLKVNGQEITPTEPQVQADWGRDDNSLPDFIKNKPEGQHLHFHCDAGEGRTTTFMVLYQIMTDNGNLSLDQILCYQYNMGGITLTDDVDRAYFLNAFYNYVEENKTDNYSIKFSQWIKQ